MRLTNGAPELPLSVLRAAYADGWFPMGERGTRLISSGSPRILVASCHLRRFTCRRVLAGRCAPGASRFRIDAAFTEVMARCAERDDTWISDVITETYTALHLAGEAHSVECWREGRLVGGLYGVSLGGAFFGESMFHVETDASKVALAALVDRLRTRGYALLDLQWVTPHLAQFGATEIPAWPLPPAPSHRAGAALHVPLKVVRAARAAIVARHGMLPALIRLARPTHWVKNGFVAGPSSSPTRSRWASPSSRARRRSPSSR